MNEVLLTEYQKTIKIIATLRGFEFFLAFANAEDKPKE